MIIAPVSLRFSKCLLALALILHILTLLAVVSAFNGWTLWALFILCVCSLWISLSRILLNNQHSKRATIVAVKFDSAQTLQVQLWGQDETWFQIVLCDGSWVSPMGMVWHWQLDGQKSWQVLMPDMVDQLTYRHLVLWARWCQTGQPH